MKSKKNPVGHPVIIRWTTGRKEKVAPGTSRWTMSVNQGQEPGIFPTTLYLFRWWQTDRQTRSFCFPIYLNRIQIKKKLLSSPSSSLFFLTSSQFVTDWLKTLNLSTKYIMSTKTRALFAEAAGERSHPFHVRRVQPGCPISSQPCIT